MLRCFGKANEEVMRVVSRGERDSEYDGIDGGGGGVEAATTTANCGDSSRAIICSDSVTVALSNALGF